MTSIYNIFPEEWRNRNDFPLELDIKYYLLQMQSKLLANSNIHPVLYPTDKIISSHFKSIVNRSEKEICRRFAPEINGLRQHELELEVALQVFNFCLPNIFEYLDFVITNYGMQYLQDETSSVVLQDYIFYAWQDLFGIWLPVNMHPVINKYLGMAEEKYPNGFGDEPN
jgi:hypothetical protein